MSRDYDTTMRRKFDAIAKREARALLERKAAALDQAQEVIKKAVDLLRGFTWCPHCGYSDDAGADPMVHTESCFWPELEKMLALMKEAQR